jgi:nondiscriminating glutamyl-tRNA synthetase
MVITRFAPSPTGSLHIGGIKMALYDYALARKNNGKYILRIEDTDRNRFVEGAEQEILDMLKIYGLVPDEIAKQSERLDIYKEYAEKLITSGDAYYCFSTKEELDALRKAANDEHKTFTFRSPYRDLSIEEAKKKIANGDYYVIRQKMPENETIEFTDPVQGAVSFNSNDVDDTVLLKTDGFPTYHLAAMVDDHLMGVTHVFRGVEWLPSVPRHVLLYKSLGWEMPVISHLAVILDPDGGKLSKRKGSVSAKGFIDEGYLPEAILNFIMLLGWSAPITYEHGEKEREIFSLEEFVELFDLKDVNKASPIFNREKLMWFNQKYIQMLSPESLVEKFLFWIKDRPEFAELSKKIETMGTGYLKEALKLEQTRIKLLSEIPASIELFYNYKGGFDFSTVKQTKDLSKEQITGFFKEFGLELNKYKDDLSDFSHEVWENFVRSYGEKSGLKAGSLFMALRLAITDSQFSPPLLEVIVILGKNEALRRLESFN